MRVLQVNKAYPAPRAGIEVVVQDLAEDLVRLGDRSAALVASRTPSVSTEHGVEVTRSFSFGTLLRMPVAPSMILDLYRLSKDADVILLHHPFPLGFLAYLLAGRGKPMAVWYHADITRQRVTGFLLRPLIRECLRRAKVILAASEALTRTALVSPYREKCRVVPFGIDGAWAAEDDAITQEAAALRAAHPGKLVLSFGRLVSYKGLPYLLRAMASVPDATLLLVGDGPDEAELRALAEELAIGDRVAFMPGPPDARPYFLACDIFVLPSVTPAEAFAVTQLEAMAYGKPVINTSLPTGVPEVSLDGETGITVPPRDEQALSAAISTLLEDDALRARYGAAAKARVAARFTKEGFATAVRAALQDAAS